MLDLNTNFLSHTLSICSEHKIIAVDKRDLYSGSIESVKVGQKESKERGIYIDVDIDL